MADESPEVRRRLRISLHCTHCCNCRTLEKTLGDKRLHQCILTGSVHIYIPRRTRSSWDWGNEGFDWSGHHRHLQGSRKECQNPAMAFKGMKQTLFTLKGQALSVSVGSTVNNLVNTNQVPLIPKYDPFSDTINTKGIDLKSCQNGIKALG